MSTVLGIDAGGTKTIVALVDETATVLDIAVLPGLDPTRADNAEAELDDFLRGVVAALKMAPQASAVGLPFHGEIAAITAMQHARTTHHLGGNARCYNDVEVAHIGAFAGGFGVLCLAGTGSMAWAKGPAGTGRTGGFGDLIGDEGSAFWIGQKALALVSQESDGRRPVSDFGRGFLQALEIEPGELIDWVYGQSNPRAGIASLARHVSALAASGATDAVDILQAAAAELAAIALAAGRAVGLVSPSPFATAGSVFLDPIVRAELARLIGVEPKPGLLPPIGGAILDAARRAGWVADQSWISRLGDELKHKAAA